MYSLNFKVQNCLVFTLSTLVSKSRRFKYALLPFHAINFLQVGPSGNRGARAPKHVEQVMARDVNNVQ